MKEQAYHLERALFIRHCLETGLLYVPYSKLFPLVDVGSESKALLGLLVPYRQVIKKENHFGHQS